MGRHAYGGGKNEYYESGVAGRALAAAGFWRRGVAFAIDVIALVLIDLIIAAGFFIAETNGFLTISVQILTAGILGVDALYFILSWWAGKTLGLATLHLKVVGLDGRRLTLLDSIIRLAGFLIATAPLGLGLIWAAGRSKRGWHDYIAGSMVIREHVKAKEKQSPDTAVIDIPVCEAREPQSIAREPAKIVNSRKKDGAESETEVLPPPTSGPQPGSVIKPSSDSGEFGLLNLGRIREREVEEERPDG